ncbi:MAG: hypothetical protein P8Y74_05255 [Desulfobacterales bacterium]|jgi:molybdopterin converting factor small subunit
MERHDGMTLTIHVAQTIRSVVKDLPKTIIVEYMESKTLRQLAVDVGIPPILIVFGMINGVKKDLNDIIAADAEIHFFGTMSGG